MTTQDILNIINILVLIILIGKQIRTEKSVDLMNVATCDMAHLGAETMKIMLDIDRRITDLERK